MKRPYIQLIAIFALSLSLAACKRTAPAPAADSANAPSSVRTEEQSQATEPAAPVADTDLAARVRTEILKDCGANLANTFSEKNKVVRYKIDAILNRTNDAAQLKSLFSVPRLQADFTSFDAASVQSLTDMVTNFVSEHSELGAADRRDLACQVAAYVHLFYIDNPAKAPADARSFYTKFNGGTNAAPATATRSIAPANSSSDRLPAAPSVATAEIEDIKAEIKLLADKSYEHDARISSIPRRSSDTGIWIMAISTAAVLFLFLVFYRLNRAKSQATVAALRKEITDLKASQKAEMEQMIENLLPIMLDRRESAQQAWEAGDWQQDSPAANETPAYEVVADETTPTQQVNFWIAPNGDTTAVETVTETTEQPAVETTNTWQGDDDTTTDEESDTAISEDTIASQATLTGGEICYAPAPKAGYFAAADISAEAQPQNSVYQLYIHADNPMLASFSIVEDDEIRRMVLADSVTHLMPAMVLDGIGDIAKATELYVAEIGEAERDGDNWRITRKGVVEYQ